VGYNSIPDNMGLSSFV